MWIKPSLRQSIQVVLTQNEMVCALIVIEKNKHHLEAITTFNDNSYCHLSSLDNPSIIKNILIPFLKQHHAQKAFISFALAGDQITQKIVHLDSPAPQQSHYAQHVPKNHVSGLQFLYVYEAKWVYMLWALPPELLFSYQMLAHEARFNLSRIITTQCALFHAYKAFAGTTFRQSTLAIDLTKSNYVFEEIIDDTQIRTQLNLKSELNIQPSSLSIIAGLAHLFKENI